MKSPARHAASLLLVTAAALGCETLPLPPRGPCEGSLPMEGDGSQRVVTFPARDFVCEGSDEPCEATEPLRSDAERTVTVTDELGGATVVYVLDLLSLPEAGGGEAIGFDLDGLNSGGGSTAASADCQEFNQDFESEVEPGVVGVDNAFQSLVNTLESTLDNRDCPGGTTEGCLEAKLREETTTEVLLLLEVTGLDSLEHDPSVEAALYLGRTTDGEPPRLTEDRRLVADQAFETVRALAAPAPGDVFHGRLRVRWPEVELPFSVWAAPRALGSAELRAGLCANGLFHGQLGGASTVDSLAQQGMEQTAFEEDVVRSVLESIADVGPSDADPAYCDRVSVGYEVEGVPAARRDL